MTTQVALSGLLSAARAIQPYTIPPRWRPSPRLLHLHTTGDTLHPAGAAGEDTASVYRPAGSGLDTCALPPDTLIAALTALRPAGKAAQAAIVTLHSDVGRLHLTVNDGPTITLDTTAAAPGPTPSHPLPGEQPITTGPVEGWRELVAEVVTAAGADPAQPGLAVVRLLREHRDVVLVADPGRSWCSSPSTPPPGCAS